MLQLFYLNKRCRKMAKENTMNNVREKRRNDVRAMVVKDKVFFNLLDDDREIVAAICHNLAKVFTAYEKYNKYVANGPTLYDLENDIDEKALLGRINRCEQHFRKHMISLSIAHGNFLGTVRYNDVERLMDEVTTFLYALQLSNAVFKKEAAA